MNLDLKNTLEETAALIQSPFYLFDTDGGMHHLQYDGQIRGMYHPFIDVLSDKVKVDDIYRREKMKWTICGCLCTANDVLCTGISLGRDG